MRVRKIYVHVGLHKTGSTSIQRACWFNKDTLKKNGIIYPELLRNELKPVPNHSGFFREWYEQATTHGGGIFLNHEDYYGRQIMDIDKHFDILLSGEFLSIPSNYAALRRFITRNFPNCVIETIVYVRSPYSHMCSRLSMSIKRGTYINLTGKKAIMYGLKQKGRIAELKKFKEVSFYSYNNVKNTTTHFANLFGVNFAQQIRNNVGWNNKRIREKNQNNKINSGYNIKECMHSDDIKFFLTKNELASHIKILNELNLFYREELGHEFCDIMYPTCD